MKYVMIFHCRRPSQKPFLVHLRACRNRRIHHQQMKPFRIILLVDGTDQHAAGIDAHHLSGRQIRDGDAGLSDQLLGLVELVNTA